MSDDEKALDYRTSGWSLRAALAPDEALARLEEHPPSTHGRAVVAAVRFVVDPAAERHTGDELVARGFRYLGVKGESASYRPIKLLDVFVDADETTYITVRRKPSRLGLSRYYILTYFDEGTCIETVARREPLVGSFDRHIVRAGHDGDILLDVASHMDAVREHVERGARILPVRDLDMVKRLATYFYGYVVSPQSASNIVRIRQRELSLVLMSIVMMTMLIWTIVTAIRR